MFLVRTGSSRNMVVTFSVDAWEEVRFLRWWFAGGWFLRGPWFSVCRLTSRRLGVGRWRRTKACQRRHQRHACGLDWSFCRSFQFVHQTCGLIGSQRSNQFIVCSMQGAFSHAPRHSSAKSVTLPSVVVSCSSMPSLSFKWSSTAAWPQLHTPRIGTRPPHDVLRVPHGTLRRTKRCPALHRA